MQSPPQALAHMIIKTDTCARRTAAQGNEMQASLQAHAAAVDEEDNVDLETLAAW